MHTADYGEHTIDIDRLIELIDKMLLKAQPVDIAGLSASRSSATGFSKKRLAATDTQFPIVLDDKGDVLDGRHRVLKARDAGVNQLDAYTLGKKLIMNARITTPEV